MGSAVVELITDDVVDLYAQNGVVCIKQAISADWIDVLRQGIDKNIDQPTDRGRIWDRDDQGRVAMFDCQAWRYIDEYRQFVQQSAMAELVGRVMDAQAVNFFYDAVFVRSPGTVFRTPFHQDEPFWSINGFDTCSVWMPLVPVEKRSALEFVRGSHRWERQFRQTNFGALTADERDQVVYDDTDGREPFPDIEGNRDDYEILSWDMEPGDCAFFNARIIHGGSGNLAPDRDLKVFNTQWAGDDVRICLRPEGMDPDHTTVMAEVGLGHGDRPGHRPLPRTLAPGGPQCRMN